MHDYRETKLAPRFTVCDYEECRDRNPPDRDSIANAIRARFMDRYVDPARAGGSGFTIMAVSCLMIEALESFRQGLPSSKGSCKEAFCSFFGSFDQFKDLRGHAHVFYKNVRCGILHRAETRGGCRIRRDKSPLFDSAALTINANLFLDALAQALEVYSNGLKMAEREAAEWKNIRRKMDALVQDCRPPV
jgi:hypothetical protein